MRQQFALQQVPRLRDVLPVVLSDENAHKTRIFYKIRAFHINFCPLLILFYTFVYQGTALKIKQIVSKKKADIYFKDWENAVPCAYCLANMRG